MGRNIIDMNKDYQLLILILMQSPKKEKTHSKSPVRTSEDIERVQKAKEAVIKKKQKTFSEKHGYKLAFAVFVLLCGLGVYFALQGQSIVIEKTLVNDVQYIQSLKQRQFKTGTVSFFGNKTLKDIKANFNNGISPQSKQLYLCQSSTQIEYMDHYNFRQKHPQCSSQILQMGNCSSGYALATASAAADRYCQKSKKPVRFSPMPLLMCDQKKVNSQCTGGYVSRALDFSKIYGFLEEQCFPTDIEMARLKNDSVCQQVKKRCPSEKKHKAQEYCVVNSIEKIKSEIITHGPLVVTLPIYRDFLVYKGGHYKVTPGTKRFPYEHAVKLIGWTTFEDKQSWIIENTFGPDWGQNGLGYIEMGQQQYHFEQFALSFNLEEQAEIQEGGQTASETSSETASEEKVEA